MFSHISQIKNENTMASQSDRVQNKADAEVVTRRVMAGRGVFTKVDDEKGLGSSSDYLT